ncbi:MAG: hypothetical protein ACLTTP_00310 [Alistipes ihumii]
MKGSCRRPRTTGPRRLVRRRIAVQCLLRSSIGSEKRDLGERIASVFELAGPKSS